MHARPIWRRLLFCCPLFFHRFLSFSNAFLVLAGVWLIKANAPRAVETELPAITFPPMGADEKAGGATWALNLFQFHWLPGMRHTTKADTHN